MRHIKWSKGFQNRGGVHPIRQFIAGLYDPRPAQASKATDIIAPQKGIVLGHSDKEVIVSS